jgi:hypothetical protein
MRVRGRRGGAEGHRKAPSAAPGRWQAVAVESVGALASRPARREPVPHPGAPSRGYSRALEPPPAYRDAPATASNRRSPRLLLFAPRNERRRRVALRRGNRARKRKIGSGRCLTRADTCGVASAKRRRIESVKDFGAAPAKPVSSRRYGRRVAMTGVHETSTALKVGNLSAASMLSASGLSVSVATSTPAESRA